MKKSILWISLCAPYDSVAHGGGKTHNYYLKKVFNSGKFNIDLITFCDLEEYDKAEKDLSYYGINHEIIPWVHDISISTIKRKIQLLDMLHNPFNKFGGATNEYYWDKIKETIKRNKYVPDIIILQWTEIVLFADRIKKLFPDAKIVAIEEDVKFLANERQIKISDNKIIKSFNLLKYKTLYNKEINELKLVDYIITYSKKDENLLTEGGISNIMVVSPFFENYTICIRTEKPDDIIFYGAMSRKDNYESAIWFINNVLFKVSDKEIKFIVVGSKPVEKLKKYSSERVIITGFVDSVAPFFENGLVLVAPLISGAGIKIKILEALSAGIPVVTNNIGIEGINAKAGRDYIHCENADEYIKIINDIKSKKIDLTSYSQNSRNFIRTNYNLENDADRIIKALERL